MPDTGVQKKLGIKPGLKMLLLNAPEGYAFRFQPIADVKPRGG